MFAIYSTVGSRWPQLGLVDLATH